MAQLQYSDCVATYTEADFNNPNTTTKSVNIDKHLEGLKWVDVDLGPRWSQGGVCLGSEELWWPASYFKEKYVIIALDPNMVPDTIYYKIFPNNNIAHTSDLSSTLYEVRESPTPNNWTFYETWDSHPDANRVRKIALRDDTRYIMLRYLGNYAGIFKDVVITAKQPLNTAVSPEGVGQVSKSPDRNFYHIGEQVTLSATATDPCYQFVRWSDGETSPTRTVTVECGGPTYTAIFERKSYTVTLHVNDASQGFVTATKIE
ncbi:MAG: hypothetical protein MJZ82_02310 [Paludibacteraceae bacterium]|nr:hypothetical protein [Paludibacteraceae bacterium]